MKTQTTITDLGHWKATARKRSPRGAVLALAHRYIAGEFGTLKYDAIACDYNTTGDTLKCVVCRVRKEQRKTS